MDERLTEEWKKRRTGEVSTKTDSETRTRRQRARLPALSDVLEARASTERPIFGSTDVYRQGGEEVSSTESCYCARTNRRGGLRYRALTLRRRQQR